MGVPIKMSPKESQPAVGSDAPAAPLTRKEEARAAAQAKRRERKAVQKEVKAAAAAKFKQKGRELQQLPPPPVDKVHCWTELVR